MREPGEDEADNVVELDNHRESTNGKGPQPQAQSYSDFKAAAERERAMEWVLKPFLPPTGLVVVAGEQKSGKTIWAAWLVAQVVARGLRVLFIELEGSRDNLLERLDLFCRDDVDRLGVSFRWRCGDRLDGKGLVTLMALVDAHAPNLIVIDPLFRAMQGDENESKTFRPIVEALEALSAYARCPVVVLHHVRKAPAEGRDAITSADVRGSSALLGAASVVAIVTKKPRTADGTARFDVHCADSWYEPFPTQRCHIQFGAATAEKAMTFVSEDDEGPALEKRLHLRTRILKVLADLGEATGRMLERTVGTRASATRDELGDLVDSGDVLRRKGQRRAWLYRLPGQPEGHPTPIPGRIQTPSASESSSPIRPGLTGTQSDALAENKPTVASASVRPSTPVGGTAGRGLTQQVENDRVRVPVPLDALPLEAKPVLAPPKCLGRDGDQACTMPVESRTGGAWCHRHASLAAAMLALDPDWHPDGYVDGPTPVPDVDVVKREELGRGPPAEALEQLPAAPTSDPQGSLTVEDVWPEEPK